MTTSGEHVRFTPSSRHGGNCFALVWFADVQTFAGRKENLNQANKLSRTHATLLEALNRHRGKGQQKATVEHVHVHNGGQAIVGSVEGGIRTKRENQPLHLDMHRAKRCGARTRRGKPCQSPAMANGRCRMHGGPSPGAPKVIGMHSSTVALPQRQLRGAEIFRHSSALLVL